MANCRKCGVEIPEGKAFCGECARSIVRSTPEPQPVTQPAVQQPTQSPPGYYYPPKLSTLPGKNGAILVIIGGILVLSGSFAFYFMWTSGSYGSFSAFLHVSALPNDFAYTWLLPIGGLLMLVFGILAFVLQHKKMGLLQFDM